MSAVTLNGASGVCRLAIFSDDSHGSFDANEVNCEAPTARSPFIKSRPAASPFDLQAFLFILMSRRMAFAWPKSWTIFDLVVQMKRLTSGNLVLGRRKATNCVRA